MKIEDLKLLVDTLCMIHPGYEIDFSYPARHSGKSTTKLAHFQGYTVLEPTKTLRVEVY